MDLSILQYHSSVWQILDLNFLSNKILQQSRSSSRTSSTRPSARGHPHISPLQGKRSFGPPPCGSIWVNSHECRPSEENLSQVMQFLDELLIFSLRQLVSCSKSLRKQRCLQTLCPICSHWYRSTAEVTIPLDCQQDLTITRWKHILFPLNLTNQFHFQINLIWQN